jgi:hypothetical protein
VEAVEAGDVRLEVDSTGCCRRAIDPRQQEQQRAIPRRTESVDDLTLDLRRRTSDSV